MSTPVYDPFSFTKAKDVVFAKLVESVGQLTTLQKWTAKAGRNSFNGHLPPCFDVWAITFGGGGDVRNTWNTTPPLELHMQANIEGVFRSQDVADEVGMKLLQPMAMNRLDATGEVTADSDLTLVQTFRMRTGGQLDVFLGWKPIANEGTKASITSSTAPCAAWILKIGCEIVFNTWDPAA